MTSTVAPIGPPPADRRHSARSRTLVSIAGSFGIQAMLLLSGVLGARILGVSNRGNLALFWILAAVPAQLLTLGIPLAVTYYIARAPQIIRPLLRSLRTPLVIQGCVLFAIHAGLIVGLYVGRHGDVRSAAALTLLATPAILGFQYALAVLQGQQRIHEFTVCQVLSAGAYSILLVPLFVFGTHSLTIVTACWVASLYATWAAAGAYMFTGLPPKGQMASDDLPTLRRLTGFGLRGLFGSIAPLESFQIDQGVVGLFISARGLGLYVIGTSLTNLPRSIAQAIGYVAYPQIAAQTGADARRSTVRFVLLTILLTGGMVVALEFLTGPMVPIIYGDSFRPAVPVARVMLISAVLTGTRRVLGDCLRGAGYPASATIAEIMSIVLLLAFAIGFVHFGVIGIAAALSTAAGLGLTVLVVAAFVLRHRLAHERAMPPPAPVDEIGMP